MEWVYQEPPGPEETPALRVSLEQKALLERTVSLGKGETGVTVVKRVWPVLQGLQELRVL